jgi:spermidine synthase
VCFFSSDNSINEGLDLLFVRRRQEQVALLLGISLISFTTLVLEISVTRIASALFTHHYAFVVLSMAVMGLGLGGLLVHKLGTKISESRFARTLTEVSVLYSLSITFMNTLILGIDTITVLSIIILAFIPFFLMGFLFAVIYKTVLQGSNLIYFSDLIGAGIGAITTISLFDRFNVVNTIFLASAVSSLSAVLFALSSRSKKVILAAFLSCILLSVVFVSSGGYSYNVPLTGDVKTLQQALEPRFGGTIVHSEWGGYGRTDLVKFEDDPHVMAIFTDGSAATMMYHFDGDFNSENTSVRQLRNSSAHFPFYFGDKEKVLIIGSGGGVDVLHALMGGAEQVHAVEVNSDTVEIVRDHADFNGGIYTLNERVMVHVDEGRSFLQRSTQNYDVIILNIPVTMTTQGVSGYALAENYLFTTNSFHDYLDHLTPNGRLVIIAHARVEVYKLTFTALQAFNDRSVNNNNAMNHLVIVEEATAMHEGRTYPLFMLKKSAFTQQEVEEMYMKTSELALIPVFFPGQSSPYPFLSEISQNELSVSEAISMMSQLEFDVSLPSDDRPFFYKFEVNLPPALSLVLIGATLLCFVTFILHYRFLTKQNKQKRRKGLHINVRALGFLSVYFSLLGLGFMTLEISLLQKFTLFLGHPTLAISITLFSLLLSSGVGSLISKRVVKQKYHRSRYIPILIGAIILLYIFLVPTLFNTFLGSTLWIRGIITLIFLFPLGFLVGIPFPFGMSLVKDILVESIPWMWCLNGLFSLLGSIVAIALAMLSGFNSVLLFTATIYFSTFVVGSKVSRHVASS